MTNRHATAEDFATWNAKAERLNVFGLHAAAEDCWEAAQAAAEMGKADREGYYRDEMHTYRAEALARVAGDAKPVRTLTAYDAASGQFLPAGQVRVIAVDVNRALVESVTTGRWSVVGASNLRSAAI